MSRHVELSKLKASESAQKQRREREQRQAEKDRILDEMAGLKGKALVSGVLEALKPNGDRSRTTAARPRVKVGCDPSLEGLMPGLGAAEWPEGGAG